jgi:SAM-dependent methyltransferase
VSSPPELAEYLIAQADFVWYQRFELAPGIFTPGAHDVDRTLGLMMIPPDLTGLTVLDIGTTNGGLAFALEARGAARVLAVDIFPPDFFGFDRIHDLLSSHVEFLQASVYELASTVSEQFDIVVFLGVLYHVRHPLLALDNVRALTRGIAYIESEVLDSELPQGNDQAIARFYRAGERADDSSNWFVPTLSCLLDWCRSAGLEPELRAAWPDPPSRCLITARPVHGDPEFMQLTYERRLRVQADHLRRHASGEVFLTVDGGGRRSDSAGAELERRRLAACKPGCSAKRAQRVGRRQRLDRSVGPTRP